MLYKDMLEEDKDNCDKEVELKNNIIRGMFIVLIHEDKEKVQLTLIE